MNNDTIAQPFVVTDPFGNVVPFLFGIDENGVYQLQFPSSVSPALRTEIASISRFNNNYAGVPPTITTGPILPPGTISGFIAEDIAETANFAVTAAQYGAMFQVTTGASNVTATLPAAASLYDGWYCFLRKADSGTGLVLNSALSDSVAAVGHVTLYWTDGTSWYSRAWYGGFDASGNLTITANSVDLNGGLVLKTQVVTTGETLTNSQSVVIANSSSALTLTMPASPLTGQTYHIKNKGTGLVTISATALIDGSSSTVLSGYQALTLTFDGTTWNIL